MRTALVPACWGASVLRGTETYATMLVRVRGGRQAFERPNRKTPRRLFRRDGVLRNSREIMREAWPLHRLMRCRDNAYISGQNRMGMVRSG